MSPYLFLTKMVYAINVLSVVITLNTLDSSTNFSFQFFKKQSKNMHSTISFLIIKNKNAKKIIYS